MPTTPCLCRPCPRITDLPLWYWYADALLLAGTGIGLANPAIAAIALGVAPPQRAT